VFFVFGVLVVGLMASWSWEVVLYALLSLTLIRMLPVAVCLLGTRLHAVSVLFAGWFGPRGLASIVLGLIVVGEAPLLAGREQLEFAVALTVLLSVMLHGFTAAPLSAAYARRVELMSPNAPENEEVSVAPTGDSKEVGEIQISSPENTRSPTKPGNGAADNPGG
jgi:sodium/hydrogen antiporter